MKAMNDQVIENQLKEDELEVELINWNATGKLGFSIAGGVGSQHFRGDNGIYIVSIQDNSILLWDGRIWVGDRLVAAKQGVDGKRIDLNNCTYENAVSILRKVCSGKRPVLIVKKTEIKLDNWSKNDHLGFSIAGGIGREHIPGDSRIYITSIVDGGMVFRDGRMSVGDRLLGVKQKFKFNGLHSENFFLMDKCTHDTAVKVLESSRRGENVSLVISKENNDNLRLRFDNPPNENNIQIGATKYHTFVFGQDLLPMPSLSFRPLPNEKPNVQMTKSILKHRKSPRSVRIKGVDEGLEDSYVTAKKPSRIRYISGVPIHEHDIDVMSTDSNGQPKTVECYNKDLSYNSNFSASKESLNSSTDNNSSTASTYEYGSVLSSMSSEDECQFFYISDITKALPSIKSKTTRHFKPSSKSRHCRKNCQHVIEPLTINSEAPVSHYYRHPPNVDSRPNIYNPSPAISSIKNNLGQNVHTATFTPFNHILSITQKFPGNTNIPKDNIITMQDEIEHLKSKSIDYFNKRYTIY